MKKVLLGTSALLGVGTLAGAAQASDGIKLDVGGFFQTVYQGVFDKKSEGHFGDHRNTDRILHNAEIHFKGETTLDNGLTVGAQIELEGESGSSSSDTDGVADQIDKSFVYWSGGFGKVQIGTMDGPIGACPVFPPGATANFSGFSPASWGGNQPRSSNSVCSDTTNESMQIKYTTPNFAGFQLVVAYVPTNNAEDYTDVGVNGAGTPVNPDGTAHHSFGAYVTYSYAGDGWGVDWGGGGSWNASFNDTVDGSNQDGPSANYQTALTLTFGGFAVGGIFEYYNNGGDDNNAWVAGGGASYGVDAWTVGIQGSHGTFNAASAADGDGGHDENNRVILTGSYEMGPGVLLDAEVGYTWFKDTADGATEDEDNYSAFDVGIGSKFTF